MHYGGEYYIEYEKLDAESNKRLKRRRIQANRLSALASLHPFPFL